MTVKTHALRRVTLRFNSSASHFTEPAAGSAFDTYFLVSLRRLYARSPVPSQRRGYAKRKMPPKKAVKEDKILLGRPGNNLKSGIVCRGSNLVQKVRTEANMVTYRSAWQMSANLPFSKLLRNALWATLQTSHMLQSTLKKLASLSQMLDMTGYAITTSPSHWSPPT